jgi:metallopeptidase MepB
VSTDSELRDASSKAEEMMDEFNIEASMREDIFKLVDAAWKREAEKTELDGESKRLLEKEWKSYVRNGLGIEKGPKRDRFKEIKKRLSQVGWINVCAGNQADDIRSKSSSRRI